MTNKYDDLDNFFRKFLNEQPISEGNWNTPDDEVWERALPQFQQNKKKKAAFIWKVVGLSTLVLLLINMSVRMYQMQNKIERLEQQQEEILRHQAQAQEEDYLTTSKENITFPKAQKGDNVSSVSNHSNNKKYINQKVNVKQIDNRQRENYQTLLSSNNQKVETSSLEQSSNENLIDDELTNNNATFTQNEQQAANQPIKPIASFNNEKELEAAVKKEEINTISSLAMQAVDFASEMEYSTPTIKQTREERRTFARTFGLELMYLSPTLMNYAEKSEKPALLGYDKWTWTQGAALNVVYQWNHRWALTSGIGRSTINKQFMAYGIEKYNVLQNSNHQGSQIENNVILKMSSPIGEMDEVVVIQQDIKKRISHNTPIVLDGAIMHHFQSIRVPVGLRYNLLKWQQLQINLEGGIGYNMIISNNYKVSYGIVVNNQVIKNEEHTIELDTPIKSNMWDGVMTLGLQQRIGKYFNLSSNVSYTQSLHPMSNNISEYETRYWRGLRWQMGFGYTF